jgi:hypothetical protein
MADMFDKEELSIVSGLFPNTLAIAEAEKLGQQEAAYKRFSGAAGTQNPFAGLAGLSGMFGTAAGQELRGLAGVQSPTTRLASLREQAAQQFNPNSPDGLVQMAQFLNQNGDSAGARQAIMLAQGQNRRGLEAEKLQGEIGIQGREIKEIGVGPELVQKAVVDKNGNIIRRVGEPYSRFSQKTTNITNLPAGETEFVKKLGKNDADTVTETMKTRATALETIKSLEQLKSLSNQELITGTLATGRVGAANLLATLGLASKADVARISTSQQYDKIAKDVIFQTLGGKLGAGFSNEDRRFIEALIPQLETSPEARRQLISYMIDKNTLVVNEATRLETYGRDKNSLKGFDYKIPRETLAPPASKPQFTRQELEAALERKLQEGKK